MPRMRPVDSTSVAAVGYDEDRHELWVQFVGGETYVYSMVPASLYRELLAAESMGRFVNARIRSTYPARTAG